MLRIISFLSLIIFFMGPSFAQEYCDSTITDKLVVREFRPKLPRRKKKADHYLWKHFANKEETKPFNHCPVKGWDERYDLFSKKLVENAEKQQLDHVSLERILANIKPMRRHAYLPVGAYLTKRGREDVWIVVIKWELKKFVEDTEHRITLGHIRMFAITRKDNRLVGFNTCM